MKCSKCNTEFADNSKFCPECGQAAQTQSITQTPSKKVSKKQGCLGCLGLILILFIALGLIGSCASKDTASTKTSVKQTDQAKEKEKAPEFTIDVEGIGKVKGGISSDVGIAVIDVKEMASIDSEFMSTKAQGKFVVVTVAVHNNQKDAITVDSSSYTLVDDQKREFEVSTEGQTAIQMKNGDAKGFLSKINPGISTSISFPFDVPKNVSGLKLKARGGFSGKKITLPLEVQKVQ